MTPETQETVLRVLMQRVETLERLVDLLAVEIPLQKGESQPPRVTRGGRKYMKEAIDEVVWARKVA